MVSLSKKACLLGDFAVGKTSLVRRFVYNRFDERYLSTIGVSVSRKTVAVPIGNEIVTVNMMLWDLAGSEEFTQVRSSYLRGASGALLVCDVARPETVSALQVYADDLLSVSPKARLVVAANKCDLLEDVNSGVQERWTQRVATLAKALEAEFYLTSAKTGDEVEHAFRHLSRLIAS